jgi:hypothetical protein
MDRRKFFSLLTAAVAAGGFWRGYPLPAADAAHQQFLAAWEEALNENYLRIAWDEALAEDSYRQALAGIRRIVRRLMRRQKRAPTELRARLIELWEREGQRCAGYLVSVHRHGYFLRAAAPGTAARRSN